MLDFKYTSTDYRVIRGDEIKIENRTEILENGMIHVRLHGGEIHVGQKLPAADFHGLTP